MLLVFCFPLSREDTQKSEYYAVLTNCREAVISKTARAYGEDAGEVLLFDLQQPGNGHKIVQYELRRHSVQSGLPQEEADSLYSNAVFGAEQHPEYFGGWPVPSDTPQGRTTRSQALSSGIYLLETERGVRLLAISYPVWQGDLTDMVQRLGLRLARDSGEQIDQTMGCLFFPKELWGVVFYELLTCHPELEPLVESRDAMIASIWKHCPQYAMSVNLMEQAEQHPWEIARWLKETYGLELPVLESELGKPNLIRFNPGIQTTDFLKVKEWE